MNIDPTNKPPMGLATDLQVLEEKIRQRAYELYLERGQEHGHDVEDWLQAKDEIMEQKTIHLAA